MTRRRYPVGAQCGHVGCPDRRCWWYPTRPHGPDNPDKAGPCRCCTIGTMIPRGASHGGLWATCNRCGTSRYVEAT